MQQPILISPDGLIISNLSIITCFEGEILTDGALLIRGGLIEDIGPSSAVIKRHSNVKTYGMPGYTACPGFVNAHTHAPMSFFRGLGHDFISPNQASSMIEDFFFPSEAKLTAELMEPLSYSYLVDGLRSGVTYFGDAYFFARGVCEALERLGLRGAVGEHHADLGGPLPAGPELWAKTKTWIENWNYSLVKPVVYGHATDTLSKTFLKDLVDYSKHHQLPFHMHLSQTEGERTRVLKREGLSPVKFAESCGALQPNSLLVHLLSADQDDLKRLAQSGATAGLCPISEIIYEKAPDAKALVEAGIPIALGTDCAASNDGADVLNEAKFFDLLLKSQGLSPQACPPQFLLDMITRNGARAFGETNLGQLAPNFKADIVFLRQGLASEPQSNPIVNLIYSMGSKQVDHVMVDGTWCLWNKRLVQVSEGDLRDRYIEALSEIKRRTNLPIVVPSKESAAST